MARWKEPTTTGSMEQEVTYVNCVVVEVTYHDLKYCTGSDLYEFYCVKRDNLLLKLCECETTVSLN